MTHTRVRSINDVAGYSPANHTGTLNHRLIAPETVGAKQIEVLHGTIQPGEGASRHAHPGIEQIAYILAGEADLEIDGEHGRVTAGDCVFFPADTMHCLTVSGDQPLRVLVIYTPQYGEDPTKVVEHKD